MGSDSPTSSSSIPSLSSIRSAASSVFSRLQGTVHKTVKGWSRLKDFIRTLRRCRTIADERKLIAKEAASIRAALRSADCPADQRWHSLAKLLFLHLQGERMHYGQVECIKAVAAAGALNGREMRGRSRLNMKRLGLLGAGLLMDDRQQTLYLLINTIKNDLSVDPKDPFVVGSALNCLASLPSQELFRELADDVVRTVAGPNEQAYSQEKDVYETRKRAVACLARMIERVPDLVEMVPDGLIEGCLAAGGCGHGLKLAGCWLTESIYCNSSDRTSEERERLAGMLIRILTSGELTSSFPDAEWSIGGVSDPVLQISILRALKALNSRAEEVIRPLERIVAAPSTGKSASFAVLQESMTTLLALTGNSQMAVGLCISRLSEFLEQRDDVNLRFVALDFLDRITHSMSSSLLPAIARHRGIILQCLRRGGAEDPSILFTAIRLSMRLVIDSATLQIILPEILKLPSIVRLDSAIGRQLVESVLKYTETAEDRIRDCLMVLERAVPDDADDREIIVNQVIMAIRTRKSSFVDKDRKFTSVAANEVIVWMVGECGNSPGLLSNAMDITDELLIGYVVTACGKMAGRGMDCSNVLFTIIGSRSISMSLRERAREMMVVQKNSILLSALYDDDNISDGEDLMESTLDSPIDNADGDDASAEFGKLVFEGRGLNVYMRPANAIDTIDTEKAETSVMITLQNPIKHPAQPTKDVSLQLAVPKGQRVELQPATGTILTPFGGVITQSAVIHGCERGRVRLRCRVQYHPAASNLTTDTFDVRL